MDKEIFLTKFFKLVSDMLDLAATEFSSHGCNDLDKRMLSDWTEEERQRMAYNYHSWNEDRADPAHYDGDLSLIPNYAIMGFMADYFKDNAEVLAKLIK